ncbi:MAG TPA: hypothetical protein VHV54_26805 [Candidatus Binatia bacterium]|nr:hypothetical protein [Candidatus Binatia bacterium]
MAHATQTAGTQPHSRSFHETTDVNARSVVLFGAGLLVIVLAAMTLTYLLLAYVTDRYTARQSPVSPLAYTRAPTPEPHLTANAPEELRRLRATEDELLNSYAWIDKENGSVRIPIDRAMEVLAQKGFPTRRKAGEATAKDRTAKATKEHAPTFILPRERGGGKRRG